MQWPVTNLNVVRLKWEAIHQQRDHGGTITTQDPPCLKCFQILSKSKVHTVHTSKLTHEVTKFRTCQ